MTRTDDDSWDLASSVGATATMVAAGRAMATKDPKGLINDPYADPLVRAVGLDFFTKMMDGELDFSLLPNSSPDRTQAIVDGMGIRTKYFDEYLLAAVQAGVRQVVILASGLDSRAYRLPWPDGTTVYEIDQPAVIEFKTRTLADLGAEADREQTHRPNRLACRLAGRVARRRPGYWRTDSLAGRGSADLPAVRSPGSVVRQHHRTERHRAAR